MGTKQGSGSAGRGGERPIQRPRGLDIKRGRRDAQGGGAQYATIQPGKNQVVIVMSVGNSDDSYYLREVQFFVPSRKPGEKGSFITSPLSVDDDADCLATRVFDALQKSDDPAARELVEREKGMRPGNRWLSNAFVYEAGAWEHRILQYPKSVYREIHNAIEAELTEDDFDEATGRVLDPPVVGSKPRKIQVTKEGAGKNTKYSVQVLGKTVELPDEALAKVQDLRSLVVLTPEADVRKILCDYLRVDDLDQVLDGEYEPRAPAAFNRPDVPTGGDDDEDEDEAPRRPAKGKAAPAKAAKAQPADDDEEDEDDDAEDDDAEDEGAEAGEDAEGEDEPDEEDEEAADDDQDDVPTCFGRYKKGRAAARDDGTWERSAESKRRNCATCAYYGPCAGTQVQPGK